VRKQSLLLIEILIVIFLIGITGTVIGIKTKTAVEKYNFQTNANLIMDKIEHLKKMSQAKQEDMTLFVMQKKNNLTLKLFSEDFILLEKKKLKNCFLDFNGQNVFSTNFLFASTGVTIPKGKIIIYDKKNRFKEFFLQ